MKTKDLVYIGVYVALTLALDFVKEMIPFLNMPQGGSINIALIPVVVASFHLGWKKGLIVATVWYIVSSLLGLNPYFVTVMQYLLDYVIPSIVIGAASIFAFKKRNLATIEAGIVVTMLIRTLCVILSGVYFWFPEGAAAGSAAAWTGSLTYNLPYSIATMVMLMIVVPLIISRIKIEKQA